ncbi:conserved hypothetical protein [Methylobacterium sp. 4-46]|uniref:hypothetical protein n=1 Tax=unclassified Methylobacterium TaxID=2615210 RepID=UPI000152D6AE|nr:MULTISPECIES: hypothetical protein [Methylobacterium]ACA17430.1 conserved hypothetical protein [Methylobacterium sp. 4-46]WFT83114.1 hypothetical protein QA634_15315 [Methylobacterium nodulans]
MSSARIVEVGETSAGIVVPEAEGFRFFAAHPDFVRLEGRIFRSPRHATRAASELRARRGKPSRH